MEGVDQANRAPHKIIVLMQNLELSFIYDLRRSWELYYELKTEERRSMFSKLVHMFIRASGINLHHTDCN